MTFPEIPLRFSISSAPGQEPVQKNYSNWEEYIEGLADDYGVYQLPNPAQQTALRRLTPDMSEVTRQQTAEFNRRIVESRLIGAEYSMGQFGWERGLSNHGSHDLEVLEISAIQLQVFGNLPR